MIWIAPPALHLPIQNTLPETAHKLASLVKNQDTSAASSDVASRRKENSEQESGCGSLMKQTDRRQKSRPVSPLKEKSMNEDLGPISKPMKLLSAGGDLKTRRRAQTGSNAAASQKRWV